jgi:heptosyltransferase-2
VVQTAFLGDLLLTIPLLRRLRQLKPLSPLILVAREGAGRLMKELELVDEVYEIRKGDPGSYRAAQEQLKKRRYEWIVCPHQSMTSAKFCWGLPAQVKVSFKQWWNFPFFKHRVDRNPMWPEPIRLLSLLQGLDPEMGPWLAEASKTELRKADIYGRLAFPCGKNWSTDPAPCLRATARSAFFRGASGRPRSGTRNRSSSWLSGSCAKATKFIGWVRKKKCR